MTRARSTLPRGLVLLVMSLGAMMFIAIVPRLGAEAFAAGLPGTDPETLWSVAHPVRANVLAALGYAGGLLVVGLPIAQLALVPRRVWGRRLTGREPG
ncbi:hypothetical protein ACOXXX_16410 [Thalassococcus sp. BH17M4-6]|uniref:hypothetical protein n=1 Tax=Thalassococcus sp. BH17M4-6 TaxID=3413148 RepID=UPI003BDC1046